MSLFGQKTNIILWAMLLLLSSCATVLNRPAQKVRIASEPGLKIISVNTLGSLDSSSVKPGKRGVYYVRRGNTPLVVTIQANNITKTIELKPTKSFAYWFNIYCNYGIGMLVDKNSPKRYAYPSDNYIGSRDSAVKVTRFMPVKKGTLNFSFSLPFMIHFNMRSIDGRRRSGGVLGLEAGVDYYYRDNNYLSVSLGAGTDQGAEHIGKGYAQTGNNLFASLRNNHTIGNLDVGYGLSLSQLVWSNITLGDTIKMDQSLKNKTLGLSLYANYRLGQRFRIGALYQPGIINIGTTPASGYQHYISFNLVWKMPMRKVL
jgi:hypothetical protein